MFISECLRFLKEGHIDFNIHGLELWTVHKLILTRMLICWLLVERSKNILKLVLSMDTWHIKWAQNILLNFYLRSYSIYNDFVLSSLLCLCKILLKVSAFPIALFLFYLVSFQHLELVIRQRIPSIIALINKTIDELNAELDRIGRPIAVDSGVTTLTYLAIMRIFFLMN